MKTIKLIPLFVLSLILIIANTQSIAQTKNTLELLKANKWEKVHRSYSIVLEFTNDTMTTMFISIDGNNKQEDMYFLSSHPSTMFEIDKVSKSKNGKYIIAKAPATRNDEHAIYEIITLSDSLLTIKSLPGKIKTAGGGAILSFKAAKKGSNL